MPKDVINYSGVPALLSYQLAILLLALPEMSNIQDKEVQVSTLCRAVNRRMKHLFQQNPNYFLHDHLLHHAIDKLRKFFTLKNQEDHITVHVTTSSNTEDLDKVIPSVLKIPMQNKKYLIKVFSTYFEARRNNYIFGVKAVDTSKDNNNLVMEEFANSVQTLASAIHRKVYKNDNPYASVDTCVSSFSNINNLSDVINASSELTNLGKRKRSQWKVTPENSSPSAKS